MDIFAMMPKVLKSRTFSSFLIPLIISGLIYLPFIFKFGYYKDDWYLMYAAGAKGPLVFNEIFSIDRPLRALVMIPTYAVFGGNPIYYNIAAYVYRLLSAIGFYRILSILWSRNRFSNVSAALLFLVYPGFLSQPNAIDYQSHLSGLAAGMISIALTLEALSTQKWWTKILLFTGSILLGLFYLGQIEWYIGLEVFRWGSIFIYFLQSESGAWKAAVNTLLKGWPALLVSGGFLIWRIFFFESVRGATDVNLQLDGFLSAPFKFIWTWLTVLGDDVVDSLFRAWVEPFRRFITALTVGEWLPGFGIALLVVVAWVFFQRQQRDENAESGLRSSRMRDGVWLGIVLLILGLLPVVMVGRTVDFKNFSRYTLVASAGVALLWQAAIQLIPWTWLRNIAFGVLLISASMTHYVNGLAHVRETERMDTFWWQVSWRIPQMTKGTTLVANYPDVTIEEDYFVWGPANLVYSPASMNDNYPQPAIYAVLLNEETIDKVLAFEKQEFSNRRGIRTYPNYRNILVITQPTVNSCIQVMDGAQPEYSLFEDERVLELGTYSELEHIELNQSFREPPQIPFGNEPRHGWCFFYEKAAFARQMGDWNKVIALGEEALNKGVGPGDAIEWMPFLQAYALTGNLNRLHELDAQITDPYIRKQACGVLQKTGAILSDARTEILGLFCNK